MVSLVSSRVIFTATVKEESILFSGQVWKEKAVRVFSYHLCYILGIDKCNWALMRADKLQTLSFQSLIIFNSNS